MLSGCNKEKALIFYRSKPIVWGEFTVNDAELHFNREKRIYFILYNPKPFTTNILRLQILKIERKYQSQSIKIIYGKDIGINPSKPYVTDYFVLQQSGYYRLRIFSPDKYYVPLAEADFHVDE